jgi:hypothetical protein
MWATEKRASFICNPSKSKVDIISLHGSDSEESDGV